MRVFSSVALLLFACLPALADEEAAPSFTPEQLEFFENRIRPVLAENCYSCHSHEAERLRGGFYLDSREAMIEDFIAEPGDVEASMLIEAVRYDNPDMQMPPDGKLDDAVIADLVRWVEMGMPWPDEEGPGDGADYFDLEERRAAHWAWQPPQRLTELPEVQGRDDTDGFIDVLIEARLGEAGLEPGPLADRATLIRRVTLDLTGLPPTPAEVQAFVNDQSPDAYEQLVDRLLASPRFGEKWGRHWLDSMRYAESYGHEFDYNIPHPWAYRNYVIRAINDDVPYDRFVVEHLAGDLAEPRIDPETQSPVDSVVATGWYYLHEQTHAPTDVRLHEADRIDNQIDVLSKTFMGMTVACARCHDHKFDAISTADYYAMAGYMQSSRQQEAYVDHNGEPIGRGISESQRVIEEGQALFAGLNADPVEPTQIEHEHTELFESFSDGDMDGWFATGWAWGDGPTTPGQWDPSSGRAAPVQPGVMHSGLFSNRAVGTLRSPEFDIEHSKIWVLVKGQGTIRVIVDSFTMARHNALLFRGLDQNINTEGQWRWIQIHSDLRRYIGGNHRAHLEFIDDSADTHLMIDEVRFGSAQGPPNPETPAAYDSVAPDRDAAFAPITERWAAATAELRGPHRVLAITDGTGENSYVHIRGAWHGHGDEVPRRTLTALGGEEMPTLLPEDGSGRLQLAQSIVDPSNPLTARVQVNRLWHHLFGVGIVPTVDNFGFLGQPPSHPELLDHLAIVFMEEDDWSNKAMIRRIVLSDAYRRSSDRTNDQAEEADPTNALLHRQRIRRMTAEMIRDAILYVSGSLREEMHGRSVNVHLTAFMQGRGRPGQGPLDGAGHRSIYISVRRNFLSPMMLAFDAPIPFTAIGRRNVTNVPAQSLTLMNDPFVHEQAQRWGRLALQDGSETIEQRVDAMFLTALGRPATDEERAAAVAFVTSRPNIPAERVLTHEQPWTALGHTLFNLKGFIYVR